MQTIALAAVPNQSFTVTLDGVLFGLRVIETNGVMSVDIDRAGARIVSGARCVAGTPLLPYRNIEGGAGNFVFLTENGELPDYREFGKSQSLLYASAAELEAIRAAA